MLSSIQNGDCYDSRTARPNARQRSPVSAAGQSHRCQRDTAAHQNRRAIAALASISGAVVILIVLLLSLYPSLRATVHNLERVSAALTVSAENFAGVSDEAAQNLTQTSANLNEASANLKNTTEHFENNLTDDGIAETIIRLLDQASQRDPR